MSKVRVKKVKTGIKDEGLAEMFNQMLGAGTVNMTIAYPRYLRMKGLCELLAKLFTILSDSPFMRTHGEFAEQKAEIDKFCEGVRKDIAELFSMDFSEWEWNLTLVGDEAKNEFSKVYERAKKSASVIAFIIMCDRLVKYKRHFSSLDNLNGKFITSMAGAEWCPFPFTGLNLKYIFSLSGFGENTLRFFMTILYKAFELSHSLYGEVSAPDINVDQFVDLIMTNMEKLQSLPELHRCRKAFQKIKDSVALLKDRFSNYYRDFIITRDSTIMMQHFILDVSKNTEADPETTRQFRAIIAYYRKVAQNNITNPKIKLLFDKVNESFRDLERDTENLVGIRDDSAADLETDADDNESDSDPISIALSAEDVMGAHPPEM